jgi:hypothetical protein
MELQKFKTGIAKRIRSPTLLRRNPARRARAPGQCRPRAARVAPAYGRLSTFAMDPLTSCGPSASLNCCASRLGPQRYLAAGPVGHALACATPQAACRACRPQLGRATRPGTPHRPRIPHARLLLFEARQSQHRSLFPWASPSAGRHHHSERLLPHCLAVVPPCVRPSSALPCSSLHVAAPPLGRQTEPVPATGSGGGSTWAATPLATGVVVSNLAATLQPSSKVIHRPSSLLRPSPATSGRQSRRRRGAVPPRGRIAKLLIFPGFNS